MLIAPEGPDSLVNTETASTLAGVSVETIRQWRARGKLIVAGLDERGRPLHRWRDVAMAERATRDRARRTFAA